MEHKDKLIIFAEIDDFIKSQVVNSIRWVIDDVGSDCYFVSYVFLCHEIEIRFYDRFFGVDRRYNIPVEVLSITSLQERRAFIKNWYDNLWNNSC
jgi:hypothetical protein